MAHISRRSSTRRSASRLCCSTWQEHRKHYHLIKVFCENINRLSQALRQAKFNSTPTTVCASEVLAAFMRRFCSLSCSKRSSSANFLSSSSRILPWEQLQEEQCEGRMWRMPPPRGHAASSPLLPASGRDRHSSSPACTESCREPKTVVSSQMRDATLCNSNVTSLSSNFFRILKAKASTRSTPAAYADA